MSHWALGRLRRLALLLQVAVNAFLLAHPQFSCLGQWSQPLVLTVPPWSVKAEAERVVGGQQVLSRGDKMVRMKGLYAVEQQCLLRAEC